MLHAQTAMPGNTEISAELSAARFHQYHHGTPMGLASCLSAAGLWSAGWQALQNSPLQGHSHLSLRLSKNHCTRHDFEERAAGI